MDAPDLQAALRDAQRGDPDAFGVLHRAHAPRVFALCLRLTADRAAADELTQDVFVQAWRALPGFRGDSRFSTWLHRLAVNTVLMARRAAVRRGRRELDFDDLTELVPQPAAPIGTTMDLEAAIAALPAGARTVFVLHDVEGYRHEEIAEAAGIAVGTSKAQLFRARRLLRARLER